jgi:hypothetical protein
MVVASAGEDHKISLWMKDQVVAVVPQPGEEVDDFIDVSVPFCPSYHFTF